MFQLLSWREFSEEIQSPCASVEVKAEKGLQIPRRALFLIRIFLRSRAIRRGMADTISYRTQCPWSRRWRVNRGRMGRVKFSIFHSFRPASRSRAEASAFSLIGRHGIEVGKGPRKAIRSRYLGA